jgi:nicotinamide-nucleotide amidase
MKAEIITIGDEILRGEIVDSNKALIAERLLRLDIECHYQSSVRDERADMTFAFLQAASRADVVLISGGLGPTRDDITTEVMAETFSRKLELDEASLEQIRLFFARLEREMADVNRKQAFFPTGSEVLANPVGTAPGFMLEHEGTLLFCMPGIPSELSLMLDEQVLPRVARKAVGGAVFVRARLLKTFGIGESSLEAELADLARDGDVEIGFRTTFPDNFLRVVARGESAEAADARIADVELAVGKRLGDLIYGADDDTMSSVVGRALSGAGASVATAESCTGGGIAERITDVPGASDYFLGGVVAYSNEAKQSLLDVPRELLEKHGAVSAPVAKAMAEGVRARFGSTYGVATTGISGPGGGSDEKPVGLVYVALAGPEGTHVEGFVYPLDRARHRILTAQIGLDWLRRAAGGMPLVGPSLLRRQGGLAPPGSPAVN